MLLCFLFGLIGHRKEGEIGKQIKCKVGNEYVASYGKAVAKRILKFLSIAWDKKNGTITQQGASPLRRAATSS